MDKFHQTQFISAYLNLSLLILAYLSLSKLILAYISLSQFSQAGFIDQLGRFYLPHEIKEEFQSFSICPTSVFLPSWQIAFKLWEKFSPSGARRWTMGQIGHRLSYVLDLWSSNGHQFGQDRQNSFFPSFEATRDRDFCWTD